MGEEGALKRRPYNDAPTAAPTPWRAYNDARTMTSARWHPYTT